MNVLIQQPTMSTKDNILIEGYIKGLLSKKEEESFLERLKSDPEFKEKVALEIEFFNALDDNSWNFIKQNSTEADDYKKLLEEEDLQNLKKTLKQVNKELNTKTEKQTKVKRLYYYVAAVASVIIILGLFFNPTISNQDLYINYIYLDDLPSFATRGSVNSYENKLVKGQKFFEHGDYQKSLTIFESVLKEIKTNASLYIYIGIAQTEKGLYKKAENTFDSLIDSKLSDAQMGYWYKALLYVKIDKIDEAKQLLNDIISKSLFNYKKAEQLLEDLD